MFEVQRGVAVELHRVLERGRRQQFHRPVRGVVIAKGKAQRSLALDVGLQRATSQAAVAALGVDHGRAQADEPVFGVYVGTGAQGEGGGTPLKRSEGRRRGKGCVSTRGDGGWTETKKK